MQHKYMYNIYFRLLDHISTLGLEGEMGALFHRWQLSRQIRIHNDKSGEIDGLIVSYCIQHRLTIFPLVASYTSK